MMKIPGQPLRLVLFALVWLLAACSAGVQRPPSAAPSVSSDLETLRRLDAGWANMYAKQDTTYALQLMSDDFIMTSIGGHLEIVLAAVGGDTLPLMQQHVKDRAGEIEFLSHPIRVGTSFRTSDTQIRLHGDAAVVTGVADDRHAFWETTGRYTATYVRGGPLGWRLVAVHMGRISPEALLCRPSRASSC